MTLLSSDLLTLQLQPLLLLATAPHTQWEAGGIGFFWLWTPEAICFISDWSELFEASRPRKAPHCYSSEFSGQLNQCSCLVRCCIPLGSSRWRHPACRALIIVGLCHILSACSEKQISSLCSWKRPKTGCSRQKGPCLHHRSPLCYFQHHLA